MSLNVFDCFSNILFLSQTNGSELYVTQSLENKYKNKTTQKLQRVKAPSASEQLSSSKGEVEFKMK